MTTYSDRDIKQVQTTVNFKYQEQLARKTFFQNMLKRLANDDTFSNGSNPLSFLTTKSYLLCLQVDAHTYFN